MAVDAQLYYQLKSLVDFVINIFLAKVNSRSRSLYVVVRPSVVCLSVCNVGAPYSGD